MKSRTWEELDNARHEIQSASETLEIVTRHSDEITEQQEKSLNLIKATLDLHFTMISAIMQEVDKHGQLQI